MRDLMPTQRRTLRKNAYQKSMRQLHHQIKKQTKQQDAAWKSLPMFGDRHLHIIKKSNLVEEGAEQQSTKPGEDEYYPSSDDRSWSGLSRGSRELTKDEDFVDEQLDDRTFWQVFTGRKQVHSDESDSSISSDADDFALRAGKEVRVKDDEEGSSDDYVNDYWVAKKQQKKDKTLFGGKVKLKTGLREQRKILKQQKEILKAAKQKKQKRQRKYSRMSRPTSIASKHESYFEDFEGAATPKMTIELATFGSLQSMDITMADFEKVDPFEIDRKEAARKRKERMERRRKRNLEKTNDEKLESLWGNTSSVDTVSNIEDIAKSAMNYIEERKEESEESDDGIPANELLPDGGDAVVQQSVMTAMNAIFDIIGGNDLDQIDDGIDYEVISDSEFEEEEEENDEEKGDMET